MTEIKQPKIRFKGHINDWEQRKLGCFLKESKIKGSDGSVAKKLTVKLWRKGVIPKQEVYSGSSATQYYIRKSGQFIYGKLDFLNQAFGLVPLELNGYESTLDSPAFDIDENMNPIFLLEYVSLTRFYKYQGNLANGSRRAKRIHVDTFLEMPIPTPSFEEQQKIGTFFKQLDDTIALHQQKLEVTNQFKQTMLKKMFPKNGETTPEIRFKGFTDDWEECKLNDVFEISSGEFLIKSKQIINGKYPVYNGGVSNTGYTNDYNFESNDDGDIIISSRGSAGSINLVKGKYWLGNSCFTLNKYKQEIDTYFILSSIYNKQNDLIKTIQKGTIPSLSKSDILKLNIFITNICEQKLIGEYFNTLNSNIFNIECRLESLLNLKQTMLMKLFI